MILNDIKLPPLVVGNLYKSYLVDLNSNTVNTSEKSEINFLGGNGKHILIVLKNDDALFLPDKQLEFLSGILVACKLKMGDISIVNVHKIAEPQHKSIINYLKAETIILMGIESSVVGLPFKIPEFQVQLFKNKKYLFVPGLDAIESNKELKKKLWEALKNIFSI